MQVHFTTGNPALGADHLHRGSIHLTQAPQSLAERDYGQALPDANLRRATVALVGVPSRFVPTDVVELLAPFRNSVREIRIFRHAEPPRLPPSLCINHSVLIKQNATEIYAEVTRTTPQKNTTSDGFVQQVEWQPAAPPRDGLCVVCLDRLDGVIMSC